jgi:sugar phosphate isomerase/epimerase
MTVPIGATSYVFRYLLSNAAKAPKLDALLRLAHDAGLDALQICENARPLAASGAQWADLRRQADDLGLRLSLGCMTLDAAVVHEYLDRVQAIGGSYLRVVLERQGESALTVKEIRRFLDEILPELESRNLHLAIENHFEIPSRILAKAVGIYPANRVGFCVDVANSLRNFEDASAVLQLLGPRAVCYHLKDYLVAGTNVGFTVSGACFGEGRIGAQDVLRRILSCNSAPQMFLETWTPARGTLADNVVRDAQWLASSIHNLKRLLSEAGA